MLNWSVTTRKWVDETIKKGPRTFYIKKMASVKFAEIEIYWSLNGAD